MADPQQVVWDEPKIEWDGDHADALARTAKPTQFENERQPSRQPGVTQSLLSEVGNAIKSVPDIIRGAANPATTARRGAALFEHDQDRAATRSPAYRAVADVGEAAGINAPGMEHDADIGNRRGIVGKAAGDALMLTGPSAIHTGFETARGRFPNYKAPEPRPFDADRAFNRTAIGGMIDLLGPSPTVGKAAAAAGTGLATEAVPWLVNKAARSKPVVDFMTKRPGPGAGEGRVPLWKQAGIQEGQRPLGQSVDVTYVPEPTPRPKPQVQSLGRDAYDSHYPSEPKGPPSDFETREAPKPYTELEEAPENLRPNPAPPTGDPVSRAAGETKNLAADMEQAAVAKPAAAPESVSATDGKPTPPVLPDVVNGKSLPISDTAKDAFQRFVKSKGKEGPLAPPKPKGISHRPEMQDDQAVKQEIEQLPEMKGPIREAPSTSLPLITKGGKPQVFYRGSDNPSEKYSGPTYFSDHPELASDIAGFSRSGGHVRPVFLKGSLGKYSDPESLAQSYELNKESDPVKSANEMGLEGQPLLSDIIKDAESQGHTGVRTEGHSFSDITHRGNEVLVFNPKNIVEGAFHKGGPKEPGRKGKAELAEEFKRGKKKPQ